MPRHRVRDIALQAGLSEATVDRVLHQRSNVSSRALVSVNAAIAELDRQLEQAQADGRHVTVEVVIEGPASLASLLAEAMSRELVGLRPRIARAPVHLVDSHQPSGVAEALRRIRKRRSAYGVILHAEEDPAVEDQATLLMAAGIPVVSVNSRLPMAASLGRAGLDETAAGSTAAYLLHQTVSLDDAIGVVMPDEPKLSHHRRRRGFDAVLAERRPDSTSLTVTVPPAPTGRDLLPSGSDRATVGGLYLLEVTDSGDLVEQLRAAHERRVIVAHRTAPALDLLRRGALDFVIDTDWQNALRQACEAILRYHRPRAGRQILRSSPALVFTPYNLPGPRRGVSPREGTTTD